MRSGGQLSSWEANEERPRRPNAFGAPFPAPHSGEITAVGRWVAEVCWPAVTWWVDRAGRRITWWVDRAGRLRPGHVGGGSLVPAGGGIEC